MFDITLQLDISLELLNPLGRRDSAAGDTLNVSYIKVAWTQWCSIPRGGASPGSPFTPVPLLVSPTPRGVFTSFPHPGGCLEFVPHPGGVSSWWTTKLMSVIVRVQDCKLTVKWPHCTYVRKIGLTLVTLPINCQTWNILVTLLISSRLYNLSYKLLVAITIHLLVNSSVKLLANIYCYLKLLSKQFSLSYLFCINKQTFSVPNYRY